jgi:hypothetical protein
MRFPVKPGMTKKQDRVSHSGHKILSSYILRSEAGFTQNEVEGLNYDAMTPKYNDGESCRKSRSG